MIERTEERFGLKPERLAADTAYGAAPMLNWLVEEKGLAPGAGARPTERGDLLEGITDDAAIVRTRRQMGIWQQHRLGRPGRCCCHIDRKSTRLNFSHANISYAVFCLKKKKDKEQ